MICRFPLLTCILIKSQEPKSTSYQGSCGRLHVFTSRSLLQIFTGWRRKYLNHFYFCEWITHRIVYRIPHITKSQCQTVRALAKFWFSWLSHFSSWYLIYSFLKNSFTSNQLSISRSSTLWILFSYVSGICTCLFEPFCCPLSMYLSIPSMLSFSNKPKMTLVSRR